jgi:hypothetical protein
MVVGIEFYSADIVDDSCVHGSCVVADCRRLWAAPSCQGKPKEKKKGKNLKFWNWGRRREFSGPWKEERDWSRLIFAFPTSAYFTIWRSSVPSSGAFAALWRGPCAAHWVVPLLQAFAWFLIVKAINPAGVSRRSHARVEERMHADVLTLCAWFCRRLISFHLGRAELRIW